MCWSFAVGPIAPGIHTGTSKDASGGYAELMPAHDSMLYKVPDGVPDELAVFADPFAVSLHAITRHPPPHGRSRRWSTAPARSGRARPRSCAALHPDVEVLVVARFDAQADMARALGATVIGHEPAITVIEEAAAWSGGVLQPADGMPMAYPGRHRRRLRHRRQAGDVRGRRARR